MVKIILPGIGGSGEHHWQTFWQAGDPQFTRFQPRNWDQPDLSDWLNALDQVVQQAAQPPVLIAHSLACLLVAEYRRRYQRELAGLFLVAVPDPQSASFPTREAGEFIDVYRGRLNCPTLLISSLNDPYASADYAAKMAADWGGKNIVIGHQGHINDVGDWQQGKNLLTAFCAGLNQ